VVVKVAMAKSTLLALRIFLILNGLYEFAICITMFADPASFVGDLGSGDGGKEVSRLMGCYALALGCFSVLVALRKGTSTNIAVVVFTIFHLMEFVAAILNNTLYSGLIIPVITHVVLGFVSAVFMIIQIFGNEKLE